MKKVIGGWKALELGARNGVIFGAVFGFLNYSSFLSILQGIEREYSSKCCAPAVFYPFGPPWYLPLVSVVFASIASLLVHRLLSRRVNSVILLWQAIGVVALVAWTGYEVARSYWHFSGSHITRLGVDYWVEITLVPMLKEHLSYLPLICAYNLIFALVLGLGRRAPKSAG